MITIPRPLLLFAGFAFALASCHAEPPKAAGKPGGKPAEKPADPKKMNKEELRKKLTPEQYAVTCENGTEPPFRNAYWNHKEPGIYVDVITGEALFASIHKFDSGSGWPSFTQPLKKQTTRILSDSSHGMIREEVRATKSDAHLGHVFNDGPKPGGQRYCINSASLRFVPVAKLKEQGYAEFLPLFEKPATK